MNDIDLTRYVSDLLLGVSRSETKRSEQMFAGCERMNRVLDGDVELENKLRITAWVEGERPTLGGGK
jgi:hypothetical protein